MLKDFKAFIMKGNVMDLAVAVVMGAAFGAIVKALVDKLIMPVVGMIIGGLDFSTLAVKVGNATLGYGLFIQAIVNFLIIAAAIFLVVRMVGKLQKPAEVTTKECPYCLTEIPKGATRCGACTSQLEG